MALCECGCGQVTRLATHTSTKRGRRKGQPMRFVCGHARRLSAEEYREEDRGYKTPCWIWQRGMHYKGYGLTHIRVAVDPARFITKLAHVVYWEGVNGPVPEGLELDHLCRQRACCQPDHLEAVTHLENVRRGDRVGKYHPWLLKGECRMGHPMSGENLRVSASGDRRCRECCKQYRRERAASRRAS